MPKAILRFYNELNDFLPRPKKDMDFEVGFKHKRSVKDMIEAIGVPHTEVDIILVNGKSVDFGYILRDGDRICVYPAFDLPDVGDIIHLRPSPQCKTKFIADINLGNIVRYMRALGFDIYFDASLKARDIIEISNKENRIILTKSRKLLKHKDAAYGLYLSPGAAESQIKTIISRLEIKNDVRLFSRCLCCNSALKKISKESISDRIPPKAKVFYNEYVYCTSCDKIYWKGTHVFEMEKVIANIFPDIKIKNQQR